jgi:hypothetical protein
VRLSASLYSVESVGKLVISQCEQVSTSRGSSACRPTSRREWPTVRLQVVRQELLAAVNVRVVIFWRVKQSSLVDGYQLFVGTCCFHLHGTVILVTVYQTALSHNLKDRSRMWSTVFYRRGVWEAVLALPLRCLWFKFRSLCELNNSLRFLRDVMFPVIRNDLHKYIKTTEAEI